MPLSIEQIKLIIREKDIPYFTDAEIQSYLDINSGDDKKTVYDLLLIKAENTTTNIAGLSVADSSQYFRKLALRYRPTNSKVLKG
jgi:hypothetical protein